MYIHITGAAKLYEVSCIVIKKSAINPVLQEAPYFQLLTNAAELYDTDILCISSLTDSVHVCLVCSVLYIHMTTSVYTLHTYLHINVCTYTHVTGSILC